MKKKLMLVMCLALVLTMFAGCAGSDAPVGGGGSDAPAEDPAPGAEAPAEGSVKTGMAVISSISKSKDAGDEDGLAQADSVIVAVTVDDSGVITNCAIDSAQTKIAFSADGKIVTPLDTVFVSKQELGADYGMAKASSLGKEWNEQANDLAAYVIGKTVDEVKGIAVTEEGVPTDAELSSAVTIKINDYIAGIEKAVANAQSLGADAADKLGIGVVTTIDKSKDAGEEDGLAQAYSNYAVVTFDGAGVITSCIIDASQANITFSADGKLTADLSAAPQTKNELGDAYGMKKASAIGKEWYEQADAFAKYVTGKTVAEVNGIALNEEGVAADAELASSVSVHIGPFMEVIEKAFNAAK